MKSLAKRELEIFMLIIENKDIFLFHYDNGINAADVVNEFKTNNLNESNFFSMRNHHYSCVCCFES